MARKTKEETEKTYNLVLDTAEQVFSESGYAHTTLHQIAERAGLTRGAIYWHFRDKQQLLDAVLERARLAWDCLPEQFASLEQAPSPRELGERIGRALEENLNDPHQHRITLILLHRTERTINAHAMHSRWMATLERIKNYLLAALSIRCTRRDGSPHPEIPKVVDAIKALLTGTLYERFLNQGDVDPKQIPRTVECLISGFLEQGSHVGA